MKLTWVDVAKGIAIMLVVYGHVLDGLFNAGVAVPIYHLQHDIVYSFHMPLFFVLSGLFAKRILVLPKLQFFRKQGIALLYPYLLWSIVQGGIMLIMSKYTNSGLTPLEFLMIPFDPFGQFWYLYDLFFIYTLYYFIRIKTNDSFILVISILLFILAPYFEIWEFNRIFNHFVFFALGSMVLNNQEFYFKKFTYIYIYIVLFAFLFSFLIGIERLEFFFAGLLGTISVIYISKQFSQLSALQYIGQKSLPIYLWHILSIVLFRVILMKILKIDSSFILTTVMTGMGILSPILFDKFVMYLKLSKLAYGK